MKRSALNLVAVGRNSIRLKALIFLALLLPPGSALATDGLRPPRGDSPRPAYAQIGEPPRVKVWRHADLIASMRAPECAAWISTNPKLLVELAGRFRRDNGLDTMLARFGAVSALLNVHYWSITDQRWERLFTSSIALDGADLSRQRPDFTVAELKSGQDTYFAQRDNRSSNQVIYRLRVRPAADSAAVEIENVTPVKYYLVRLYPPGSLRFLYLLHRASLGVWEYYSLMEVGSDASSLTEGGSRDLISIEPPLYSVTSRESQRTKNPRPAAKNLGALT